MISVGTGAVIQQVKTEMGCGAGPPRAVEDAMVEENGINRRDVMYNDFIIVGPQMTLQE